MVYPVPDLALSIAAGSEFRRVAGTAMVEFQPDLGARRNVSFYLAGDLAEGSVYGVTAGIRIYFGPDKPLIRRHREDDPEEELVQSFLPFSPNFTGGVAVASGPTSTPIDVVVPEGNGNSLSWKPW
jgi:hypothetical protein